MNDHVTYCLLICIALMFFFLSFGTGKPWQYNVNDKSKQIWDPFCTSIVTHSYNRNSRLHCTEIALFLLKQDNSRLKANRRNAGIEPFIRNLIKSLFYAMFFLPQWIRQPLSLFCFSKLLPYIPPSINTDNRENMTMKQDFFFKHVGRE